jgi:hypothetical protein
MDLIDSPEFQIILQLLSPDYMRSAAARYGDGDIIRGAPEAYIETRKMTRMLVNQARERNRVPGERLPRDMEFALLMRNLGWPLLHKMPALESVADEGWRRLACAFWPNGTPINGGFKMYVGDASFQDVYEAAIIATSNFLHHYPQYNRAVLDDRVWSRKDSALMVHFEVRNDLRSLVMDPRRRDTIWVHRKLSKGLRSAVKFSKSEMGKYATQLLIEWARAGFISAPAGAMVSGAPGIEYGWGALVPSNGIPLVICVNEPIDKRVFIGVTPDHRAFDGKVAKHSHQFLYDNITEILK